MPAYLKDEDWERKGIVERDVFVSIHRCLDGSMVSLKCLTFSESAPPAIRPRNIQDYMYRKGQFRFPFTVLS
jgi:hypothetical protein